MKNNSGFTLMETLVALVIFSIMATGFTRYVSERAKQTAYLTDKTLAAIVASNALSTIQISGQLPQLGQTIERVSMADRQWRVAIDVENSEHPSLRRMEVNVGLSDSTEPLVSITGFAGQD